MAINFYNFSLISLLFLISNGAIAIDASTKEKIFIDYSDANITNILQKLDIFVEK